MLASIQLDANTFFNAALLAICGWTLLEVIHQGKKLAALQQKVDDLPCHDFCKKKL